jgi:hypothetical protein
VGGRSGAPWLALEQLAPGSSIEMLEGQLKRPRGRESEVRFLPGARRWESVPANTWMP